jgi:hypothetical protein
VRSPGANLPVTNGWAQTMTSGPSDLPVYLQGAIGTSFMTPAQGAWNDGRKKYGSLDDPDAGGYQLNQIIWDKDNGDAEMTTLEATNGGWYAPSPGVICNCSPDHNDRPCRCH